MSLKAIGSILQHLESGYFVWRNESGSEFVILPKEAFDRLQHVDTEGIQLPLTASSAARGSESDAEEILQRINREIALYQVMQEEGEIDFDDVGERLVDAAPPQPSLRVRFEPLRGDLPPELQE